MKSKYYEPLPLEKIIAALSYLTMGLVGFVWLILGAIMKQTLRPFLAFHIYQSIFLSILFYLVSCLISIVLGIFSYIPFIGGLISTITFHISTPIIGRISIIGALLYLLMAYLVIMTLRGKLAYIPWVSDIIKSTTKI